MEMLNAAVVVSDYTSHGYENQPLIWEVYLYTFQLFTAKLLILIKPLWT